MSKPFHPNSLPGVEPVGCSPPPPNPIDTAQRVAAAPSEPVSQGDELPDGAAVLPFSGIRIRSVRGVEPLAIESIMLERERQIERGYTAQSDDLKTVWDFIRLVQDWSRDLDLHWPIAKHRRSLPALRRCAVKLAGTTIALIERIDREETRL